MAKKQKVKDDVPNPNGVSNRDIIQRLNFLYQASVYLNSVSGPGPSASGGFSVISDDVSSSQVTKAEKRTRKRRRKNVVSTADLSRSYIKSMRAVGQKTTVKMCVPYLSPSQTATFRISETRV